MSSIFTTRGKHAFWSPSSGGFATTLRSLLVLSVVVALVVVMSLAAFAASTDADGDGKNDNADDCPGTAAGAAVNNRGCSDAQLSALVDADNDGVTVGEGDLDDNDACVPDSSGNPDSDRDGIRNECDTSNDTDADNDGVTIGEGDPDDNDACVPDSSGNPDSDGDGIRNECEDSGGNGIGEGQGCGFGNQGGTPDADGDGIRDACDADDNDGPDGDLDGDGTKNSADPDDNDVCIPNNGGNPDADGDEVRDACDANDNDGPDGDLDGDGVTNSLDDDDTDVCIPNNGGEPDADADGIRDLCDPVDDRPPLQLPTGTTVTISVIGITNGASYEHGSVPTAACASNGFGLPSLSLSEITGPLAAYGIGTQTATCTLPGVGSASATYTIVDTIGPVLDLPDDITITSGGGGSQLAGASLRALQQAAGTVVTYSASATDAVTGPAAVACQPSSGSSFPVGATTVTCSATDLVGNLADGTFRVTVVAGASGGGGRPSDDDGDDVLGKRIDRNSPNGSGTGNGTSVLGSSVVRGSVLPTTGASTIATFVLIAVLLLAVGIGSSTIGGRREENNRLR